MHSRKIDLILRSVERRVQMQFSITRKFLLRAGLAINYINIILRLTRHSLRKLKSTGGERSSKLCLATFTLRTYVINNAPTLTILRSIRNMPEKSKFKLRCLLTVGPYGLEVNKTTAKKCRSLSFYSLYG